MSAYPARRRSRGPRGPGALRPALAVVPLLGLAAGLPAAAATTVEFVWTASTGLGTPGGASIEAQPGDRLTGEVRISTTDSTGIAAYGVSLSFDADLGDELNLASVTERLPPGFTHNLTPGPEATQESSASQQGGIRTVEALALTAGGSTGVASAVAAEVELRVTANVATDGVDLTLGAFSPGVDAIGNGANVDITSTVVFHGASVNRLAAVPNDPSWMLPGLVLLLGALGAWSSLGGRASRRAS